LTRFRSLKKESFYLHLKECEFRFNHRGEDLYKVLLKTLRSSLLF
jgi:transposase-like protein